MLERYTVQYWLYGKELKIYLHVYLYPSLGTLVQIRRLEQKELHSGISVGLYCHEIHYT